jgi:hypothetical protein
VLGHGVMFFGHDLGQEVFPAGEEIPLTVCWQSQAEMSTSYIVFTHLLNGDGVLLSQEDQISGAGKYPIATWQPPAVIVDQYHISVPEDMSPVAW